MRTVFLLTALPALLACGPTVAGSSAGLAAGPVLSAAVVLSPDLRRVVVAGEEAGSPALLGLDAATGEVLWRSPAARPLLHLGDLVLARGASEGAESLPLALLDASTGARRLAFAVPLPSHVRPLLEPGPGLTFQVTASPSGDQVLVSWTWRSEDVRASVPGPGDSPTFVESRGWALVDPRGGTWQTLEAPPVAPAVEPPHAEAFPLPAGGFARVALRDVAGGTEVVLSRWGARGRPQPDVRLAEGPWRPKNASADRRHVLLARVLSSTPPRYAWRVYDVGDGALVLETTHDLGGAPFVVAEGRLLHLVPGRFTAGALEGRAAPRLRAVDAAAGREAWSVALPGS